MRYYRAKQFNAQKAWDAQDIAIIEGASVRLHWSDQPYIWHKNDGQEVFVVLDGCVVMKSRSKDESGHWQIKERQMHIGDICHAQEGDEHVAHPQGPARMLVIEKVGTV
ncbi:MAG: cupin [Cohaesibacter sp.]|nr:cupin [Cohaesibacter sp.]MCV6600339.1 cupin [Cohaesibacter sp.]